MNEIYDIISDILTLGGPVVALLGVASVFALTLIIYKFIQFGWAGIGQVKRPREAIVLWKRGQKEEAFQRLKGQRGLIADAVRTAFVNMADIDMGSELHNKRKVEDIIDVLAVGRMHELQFGLRALDAIAQLAPLLGLFGTVLGMIDAFQALQGAGSSVDPSILAGGIWVALLTTAVGLAVAMPISLILTWFETRLENERVGVETTIGELLNQTVHADDDRSVAKKSMFAHAS